MTPLPQSPSVTPRLTPERLAEWVELCERATQGPWVCDPGFNGVFWIATDDRATTIGQILPAVLVDDPHADAAFIAAARTALPELLAELRSVRERGAVGVGVAEGHEVTDEMVERVATVLLADAMVARLAVQPSPTMAYSRTLARRALTAARGGV